ncbi:Hypothetical predicted protein [Cloeon dipterum]|uniref:Uncharacterized protein n=1 Tax=Cloeon dipterum TaxID=197152 RepID=A0A8S1C2P3_9INSE|nr:Hypothetical predicted protein [Cloeon dipterum]
MGKTSLALLALLFLLVFLYMGSSESKKVVKAKIKGIQVNSIVTPKIVVKSKNTKKTKKTNNKLSSFIFPTKKRTTKAIQTTAKGAANNPTTAGADAADTAAY